MRSDVYESISFRISVMIDTIQYFETWILLNILIPV